jgi:hypothetical protein
MKKDAWPYNPYDPMDKYPYLKLSAYLNKRGHADLVNALVTWGLENETEAGSAKTEKGRGGGAKMEKAATGETADKAQRSKTIINKMKLSIRLFCPELSMLIESKEAHVRLMAGSWAAFRFSQWPIWLALIILIVFFRDSFWAYLFINMVLLAIIFFCNRQIESLFHYRRVSELFHIVQSAYFAEQRKEQHDAAAKAEPKEKRKP